MTNEAKRIIKYLKNPNFYIEDFGFSYKRISLDETNILLDYITKLQEENKIVDKIRKLRSANTHVENIYYAEGVLLNEPYCDIEDVYNEELLEILRGKE